MTHEAWSMVFQKELIIVLSESREPSTITPLEQVRQDRQEQVLKLGDLAVDALLEKGVPTERMLGSSRTGWVLPGCLDYMRESYDPQQDTTVRRYIGIALVDEELAWVASPRWHTRRDIPLLWHQDLRTAARKKLFETVVPFTDDPEADYRQLAQTAGAAALGFLKWRFCYPEERDDFDITDYSQAEYRGTVGVEAQIAAILIDTIKRPRVTFFRC